jgi:glycosyltransferase involved in cell wall biosynthesis
VRRLLASVREAAAGGKPTPDLLVRTRDLAGAGGAIEALAGIARAKVHFQIEEAPDLAALRSAIDRCRHAGLGVEVEYVVGPSNWYDLEGTAELCAATGSRLLCRVEGASGGRPLASLPPDEVRFVCMSVTAIRDRFLESWAGVSVKEYDQFLEECRAIHRERTEAALFDPSKLAATAALLRFPPPSHPTLLSETATLALLARALRVYSSPALASWIQAVTSEPGFVDRARRRFELRWLALWGAAVFKDASATGALRAVYGDEATREALLHGDTLEAARHGVEDCFRSWSSGLHLDRIAARRAPFHVPPAVLPADATKEADVTVVVPAYMHEAYVEECLRSVLAQSYPHHRVVLVDDASTDATLERARGVVDDRLVVRARRENVGLGTGLAEILAEVRTPFVAVLNSDDFFHPERLEQCRAALLAHPEAALVATGVVPVDASGRTITAASAVPLLDGPEIEGWVSWYESARKEAEKASALFPALLRHNFLATSSNLFARTEFLRQHHRVLRDLKYCVDWQLFLEAAAVDGLVYLPADLVAYRLHKANTVWFRGRERWRFLLEVNRVVAGGLRMLLARAQARGESPETTAESLLEALVEQIERNEEVDGFALFLDQVLGEVGLESLADRTPRIRRMLATLERFAAERREAGYLRARIGAEEENLLALRHEVPYLRAMRNLAEVTQEELGVRQGAEAFLRRYKDELERRVGALHGDLENERRLRALETARLQARVVSLENSLGSTEELREVLHATRERLEGENEVLRADREHLEIVLVEEKKARAAEAQRSREEVEKLRASPEYRVGNWAWHKLRVGEFSRRAKKRLRHARDRKTRLVLGAGRALRGMLGGRDRAVVASCWNFPIYSHTFVYQEMLEMRRMGFRVKLFCWATSPRGELHPAFRTLWDNRVLLQADWWIQQRDLAYWRRKRPERVEELLSKISAATGRTRDDLLQDWLVMAGFTFARILELSGAEYLHSYFFYDQSFMATMAGVLTGIPRGVTAYADHMLDDYPLKCVALNLELADVVVATSRRVRDELSAIVGGRFGEKIFVKPNGVDVARFPFVAPEVRTSENGVAEIAAVNRIEPKKGLVYLARAMRLLADRGVAAKLHIVGAVDPHNGTSRTCAEELERTIRELGLEDRVVLHGAKMQPEVVSILSRSRIFAAPYIEVATGDKDGIPTAMLEAMANGLPVVATDAGSIPEVVRDGVEALCVPQRDPEKLADAMERVLRDPDLGARLARAARARVEAEFSTDATEGRLHERIEALLARRREGGPARG